MRFFVTDQRRQAAQATAYSLQTHRLHAAAHPPAQAAPDIGWVGHIG